MLSTTKTGSQQHAKPTTTATKRFVTLASSTFTRRSSGLFSNEKTRFDLDTARNTLTEQIVMIIKGVVIKQQGLRQSKLCYFQIWTDTLLFQAGIQCCHFWRVIWEQIQFVINNFCIGELIFFFYGHKRSQKLNDGQIWNFNLNHLKFMLELKTFILKPRGYW